MPQIVLVLFAAIMAASMLQTVLVLIAAITVANTLQTAHALNADTMEANTLLIAPAQSAATMATKYLTRSNRSSHSLGRFAAMLHSAFYPEQGLMEVCFE